MARCFHSKGGTSPQHVFIATPATDGHVAPTHLFALLQSLPQLQQAGIAYDHYLLAENCHVDDARNAVLRDFMQTDCTDLIFIDADVAWDPADLIKILRYDRDVVAGVYPKRSEHAEDYPVLVAPGTALYSESDGLVRVDGAPTGFMRIRRHVIATLMKVNQQRRFIGQNAKPGDPPYTVVFERTFEQGMRRSGDYEFCRQWQKCGGEVYVDPNMVLLHEGPKEYIGCLGDWWKGKHGVLAQERRERFDLALLAIRQGTHTASAYLWAFHGWDNPFAASPECLYTCCQIVTELTTPVLETGSGLSTLLMAISNPAIEIHCLEHDPIWATHLRNAMIKHSVTNIVIHLAPLLATTNWYDISDLPDLPWGLVVCDGPPRQLGQRRGLFDQLGTAIASVPIIMDDADDPIQIETLMAWSNQHGRQVQIMEGGRPFAVSTLSVEKQSAA